MKTFFSLFAVLSGLSFAETSPEGLTASDWTGIRNAHETANHAAQRNTEGHLIARNPGQQWSTEFDGRGFTITPDKGDWTWGLELTGYGNRTLPSGSSPLENEGKRITCQRDENLTEWFVNDSRGLEQGWDLRQRPEREDPVMPLHLHLSTRGKVQAQVSSSGDSVSFLQESGANILTYGGLKAWDADGKQLAVRFEQAGKANIRIAIEDQAARYPITIDPVAQQAFLKASDRASSAHFGDAVAISGDTVVVGSPEAGRIYIFVRSGGTWIQQASLTASNITWSYDFGSSVAISGDIVVVGAIGESNSATGVNGNPTAGYASYSGAAYIFVRNGTTWTQQAYLKASNAEANDQFGSSVAVSGDTVVVGAPNEASNATGSNGNQTSNTAQYSGAAYVFTRSGTTWTQQAYLKASNNSEWDHFGFSVAASGDTVLVGAVGEMSVATGVNGNQTVNGQSPTGAAYVFTRSGTTWSQQAYLKASNTGDNDSFGISLAISGDTAVIGAPGEDSNATGTNGNQANNSARNSGAAYVFTRSDTTWTQQAYLKASNTSADDSFATSVAISGDRIVVGAHGEDSIATGIDGNQADNSASGAGAAYVFVRMGTTWHHRAYLKASNAEAGDQFGISVAIEGETVVSGAPMEDSVSNTVNGPDGDNYSTDSGAAYIIVPLDVLVRTESPTVGNVDSGGTKSFPPSIVGDTAEMNFTLHHHGMADLLLTGTPKVSLTGSSDFTVTAQPSSPVAGFGGSTSFTVRFVPTAGGIGTASLSIPNNHPDQNPFIIHLSAKVLSYETDTDGDGLSDLAEYHLAPLNFNWQVSQTVLVNTYFAQANGAGLYAPNQVHALRRGTTSVSKDQSSGRIKLTTHWKRSTNLADFLDFPAPAGSSVSISPAGEVEFDFAAPDNAALLLIDQN